MTPDVQAHYKAFRVLHPDAPAYICHLWAMRRAEVAREVTADGHARFLVVIDGTAITVSVLEDAYGPDACERKGELGRYSVIGPPAGDVTSSPGCLSFVMFASIKGAMLDCVGGIEASPWWTAADTDEQGWYMREMAHDVASGAIAVYESRESV